MEELRGTVGNGSRYCLLPGDCEASLVRDVAPESMDLVVTGPPFFQAGMAYERPEETWEEHWAGRRKMLDACVRALRPGTKLALHLADCPNFECHTGLTEEKLIPAVYADYLRREHGVVLWRRFLWVQPEPWTHYQHVKRLALPQGGQQVLVDVARLVESARPRPRSKREQSRLGWEYLLVFRKPGPVTEHDLREFACLGWAGAYLASTQGCAGELQDLPLVSDTEKAWRREAMWYFPPEPAARTAPERAHPCPWPVAVPDRLVRLYSSPGEWVLDPYLGSGATAEAALAAGRNIMGYELCPDYWPLLRARVERVGACSVERPPEESVNG